MISFTIRVDGIVHLRLCPPYAETDEESYLEALERIGEIEGPYAMVVDISGHVHLSRDGELRQAAWAKATRAHISAHCRALAMVRETPNPRAQQSFARLWQIPVHVTSDDNEAMRYAQDHLASQAEQP